NWITPYTTHVKDAMAGKTMVNFLRGGLKEEFVKTSAYGKPAPDAARKNADAIKAQMVKGGYVIFKGPLKDNTAKTVIDNGLKHSADQLDARPDDQSGLGRHRQGVRPATEPLAIPIAPLAASMLVFGVFMAALKHSPLEVYALIYQGGFASAFSWQNTLARA